MMPPEDERVAAPRTTVGEALQTARKHLGAAGIENATHDARLILQAVTGMSHSALITGNEQVLDEEQFTAFQTLVARRTDERMSVARLLGRREFRGLELAITSATLEPRDDTEAVIDLVLRSIEDADAPLRIADLGTGSGAIALALLQAFPRAQVVATDIDPKALATARANAERNGLGARFQTAEGSWTTPLEGAFDIIISNPPYIASRELDVLQPEVRLHDPRAALDGGADGLEAYRAILAGAGAHLAPHGQLAIEIGYDQKAALQALALASGWSVAATGRDLGGRDRALLLRIAE